MPMHVAACNPTHRHTFPPLFWATCPRKVGGKYANAWGCMQPQALAYMSPTCLGPHGPDTYGDNMPKRGGGMEPHALANFSPCFVWATWTREVGGNNMPMHAATHCYVLHHRLLYVCLCNVSLFPGDTWPRKEEEICAQASGSMLLCASA